MSSLINAALSTNGQHTVELTSEANYALLNQMNHHNNHNHNNNGQSVSSGMSMNPGGYAQKIDRGRTPVGSSSSGAGGGSDINSGGTHTSTAATFEVSGDRPPLSLPIYITPLT